MDAHGKTAQPVAPTSPSDATLSVDELRERIRRNNRTLLEQSRRLEELESVLSCVAYFSSKLKQLEAESNS